MHYISFLAILLIPLHVYAQTLAFPTAEGWGRFATGGRGGIVCHVDTLSNGTSGAVIGGTTHHAGSFRYCTNLSGARTIVFDVSGIINYGTDLSLVIENPLVTIAGQTAPGDGVIIRGATLRFVGNHSIGRYLRVYNGSPSHYPDGPDSQGGIIAGNAGRPDVFNVIIDHSTAIWGNDDNLSAVNSHDVTFQWNIVGAGLDDTINPGSGGAYSKAGLMGDSETSAVGSNRLSVLNNLMIHVWARSLYYQGGDVQVYNNVVYNTHSGGFFSPRSAAVRAEYLNNYHKHGPHVGQSTAPNMSNLGKCYKSPGCDWLQSGNPTWQQSYIDDSVIYFSGNFHSKGLSDSQMLIQGEEPGVPNSGLTPQTTFTDPVLGFPSVPSLVTATEAYARILSDVGARIPSQSSVEATLISHLQNSTGYATDYPSISDVSGYGGYPTLSETSRGAGFDTDSDGIPDTWETLCSTSLGGLSPSNSADGSDIIAGIDPAVNGYSKLEVYLNELAGDYTLNSCGEVEAVAPYTILKTTSGITVDGAITEFSSANPVVFSGGNGNETTVRLMWDDTNLYIGATTTDTELNATNATHDSPLLYLDDGFEFVIDTENNGGWDNNDYKVHISALGTRYDRRNLTDTTWEGPYTDAVALVSDLNTGADDTSWTVEIEIPWTSLGMTPIADDVVKINFQVNDLDSTRILYTWNGNINDLADASLATFSATEIGNDTTPPTGVAITSPADASTVRGVVQISGDAVDETNMSHVVFTRVGAAMSIGIDSTGPEPWTILWNTHTVPDGSHDLRIEAFDTSDNSTVSADITVTIDNTTLSTFSGIPTSPSTSAAAAPTFPGVPTSPSTSASTTPTSPGVPTSPSTSASTTPTFPGVPTGATMP